MQLQSDTQLLGQYAFQGSEAAFGELVARHADLVYSAALRQVDSPDLAGDIAQSVFMDLARKARTLAHKFRADASLVGWLYRSTRFAALETKRSARRRQLREKKAMNELHVVNLGTEVALDWERLRPLLDEALSGLGDADRDALLLRFFKNHDFRAVGVALGISDDAAQKRVSRALEKLRGLLGRRGITTTSAALSLVISANAVQSAPIGLVTMISCSAVASMASAPTVVAATKALAMTTIQKTLMGAVLAAAIGTGIYKARQASHLSNGLQVVRQQQTELTRPPRAAFALENTFPRELKAPSAAVPTPGTNAYSRWLAGGLPEIKGEQLRDYLEKNRYSPASLLAAFRATDDKFFLRDAMEKYPNDPRVALSAILEGGASADAKRAWIESFKQSAPDNALANYLSASDFFKAGQTLQVMQELVAASSKSMSQDYWAEATQNMEEAYRAAGYSEAEAKTAASSMRVPEFLDLRELDHNIVTLAQPLGQGGDQGQAQSAIQSGLNLGQLLADPNARQSLGQYRMGMEIEQRFLRMIDPNTASGTSGDTAKSELDQIAQQLQILKKLTQKQDGLLRGMSDQDLIDYADQLKVFGGLQALQWLVNRQPAQ